MFNSVTNLNRKAEKYGDLHFVSFFSAILARLAYLNDNNFLINYNKIMGPVVNTQILKAINDVDQNNLAKLLDDQTLFGLNGSDSDIFKNFEYQYKGKNYIDFIKLNMPQNVNIINGDLKGTINYPLPGEETPNDAVKYISIGWSNYGEVFVVADKRMPNTIFLLFRGTYSAKTAALYSKPTSAIPLTVCKDSSGKPEQFLYGIFKATTEMIHTIIEAMRYLATNFLGASTPNSVKIFTTGHSLGNAMCVDFAYLWMGIKNTAPYNTAPYNVLADNIICIGLGGPRCMSSSVANKFCNFVKQNRILFLRITTNGDPVPALPPKNPLYPNSGFEHPCSSDEKMRSVVSEACASQLTVRPTPNINYQGNLDCLNYKARVYGINPLSHTVYLDIIYTNAVDIVNFLKGFGISKEVLRTPDKSTVCRLIMGESTNYKTIFFDVNKAREIPTTIDAVEETNLNMKAGGFFNSLKPNLNYNLGTGVKPKQGVKNNQVVNKNSFSSFNNTLKVPNVKIGGKVSEDRRMTLNAFNQLIQLMVPLSGNLCPPSGKMANPFNNEIMPDLSCPASKFGGKRKTKKTKKSKKSKTRRYR
jgi:hypothetical protein